MKTKAKSKVKVKINNPYEVLKDKNCDYRKEIMRIAEETSSTINISYNGDAINKINKVYNSLVKTMKL